MNSVNMLICMAGLAWAGQIALGWLQMRRFNEALARLPSGNRVGIGRSGGRFVPRLLLVLSVDANNIVTQSFIMKGITVFSRPVAEDKLHGMRLENINPEQLFPHNKAMRSALELAITNKR
ncbi:transcriptional regulator GutM [Enterobacter roggenkampii]|uniref:transcriptional regulator GutM n=1 Tax=Enterobacter roggenkampii TaxID=1812935 RepID=UPI0008DD0616|nr:transcriptional regulator GutM [Enterobacter roggenkampii]OHY45160.1 transcriptional regulator GutM [Enterobacter roggenkampii]OHY63607.1 transcriptional regulator GutM [Enterobacter roggenkampii]